MRPTSLFVEHGLTCHVWYKPQALGLEIFIVWIFFLLTKCLCVATIFSKLLSKKESDSRLNYYV